jgi:phytoene dehydrogenase-like protein
MLTKYDVIIIGGGISGLFLGALLSKQDLAVLVCEKRSQLGGRYGVKYCRGFEISFGFKGNRFAQQGYVQELFDLLNEPLEFVCAKGILIYEGKRFSVLPRGLKPTLLSANLSWLEKVIFIKLYRQLLAYKPQEHYKTTIYQWLSERTQQAGIFNLFRYYSQLGLVSPDLKQTSLGEFIALAQKGFTARYPFGVPKGGWGSKLSLLKSIIEARGHIRTNCRADEIVVQKGRVKGIRCKGEFISARVVITAFPLNLGLFELIDEKLFPKEWGENIKRLKPTTGINLDFCLSRKITSECRLVATHEPYPVTQGIFESNLIPEIAPPGKLYGSWLLLVPHEKFADRAYLKQQGSELRELLAEMFPGIWDCCLWRREMRLSMVNAVAPWPDQTREDKPDFMAPGIDNLFLAGDSTRGAGGGGDVAMNSILQVYKLILARITC